MRSVPGARARNKQVQTVEEKYVRSVPNIRAKSKNVAPRIKNYEGGICLHSRLQRSLECKQHFKKVYALKI